MGLQTQAAKKQYIMLAQSGNELPWKIERRQKAALARQLAIEARNLRDQEDYNAKLLQMHREQEEELEREQIAQQLILKEQERINKINLEIAAKQAHDQQLAIMEEKRLRDEEDAHLTALMEQERVRQHLIAENARKDYERLAALRALEERQQLELQNTYNKIEDARNQSKLNEYALKAEKQQLLASLEEKKRYDQEQQNFNILKDKDSAHIISAAAYLPQSSVSKAETGLIDQIAENSTNIKTIFDDEVQNFAQELKRVMRNKIARDSNLEKEKFDFSEFEQTIFSKNYKIEIEQGIQMAALPNENTNPISEQSYKNQPNIIKAAQEHLNRLGCYNGNFSGNLNKNTLVGLETAEKYLSLTIKRNLRPITEETVDFLKNQKDQICTGKLQCDLGQIKQQKTCIVVYPKPALIEEDEEPAARKTRRTPYVRKEQPIAVKQRQMARTAPERASSSRTVSTRTSQPPKAIPAAKQPEQVATPRPSIRISM